MRIEDFGLTKTERMLFCGLDQFGIPKEDMKMIAFFLKPDDHVLMIHFLKTHPDATHQDIMQETARLLKQRKRLENQ